MVWGKEGVGKSGVLEEIKRELGQDNNVAVWLVGNVENVGLAKLINDGFSKIRKNVLLLDNLDECTLKRTVNMVKTID
jgi:hypothetical protein